MADEEVEASCWSSISVVFLFWIFWLFVRSFVWAGSVDWLVGWLALLLASARAASIRVRSFHLPIYIGVLSCCLLSYEGMDGDADRHEGWFHYLSLAGMMSNEMEFGRRGQAEKEQTMLSTSMQTSVVKVGLMQGRGGGWMDGWMIGWLVGRTMRVCRCELYNIEVVKPFFTWWKNVFIKDHHRLIKT